MRFIDNNTTLGNLTIGTSEQNKEMLKFWSLPSFYSPTLQEYLFSGIAPNVYLHVDMGAYACI